MKLTKVIVDSIAVLIEKVGSAIDKNVTSDEERLKAKKELTNLILTYSVDMTEIQKDVMLAEIHGNKYQRSWRPSLMYMSMFIIFTTWFVMPLINIWLQDPNITSFVSSFKDATDFWDIIKLGVGAFGIGRSMEKITQTVATNMDVQLKRKKRKGK